MEFVPEPPLLHEAQAKSVLQGATRAFPGNVSTVQYFQNFVTKSSLQSKVGIIHEERELTFRELDDHSEKLALGIQTLLLEKGVKNLNPNGDWVIGVCLPPSDQLICCLFAIHKLGAGYVPIDATFPENRVTSMITSCRPVLLISDSVPSTLSKFNLVQDQTLVVSIQDLCSRAMKVEPVTLTPFPSSVATMSERVAIILYTSGSSGAPKGVRLTHRTIMNRLFWQWETFPFCLGEKCCFKTALTFVDSVPEIFGPLLQGIAVNVFSKLVVSNPNLLIKKIHAVGITRIVVVPSLLRALLSTLQLLDAEEEKGREKLNSIRLWICSGETLLKKLVDQFFSQFPASTLCNFYGSTEIMGDVTYETFSSVDDVAKQVDGISVSIGIPTFNTFLYILSEDLNLTPEGDIGELYVAGYNLCSGYVGNVNQDKFIDNPFTTSIGFNRLFRTGDYVRISTKNGKRVLFYEGRSDSQVKVRGQRVDLMEIESVLNSQTDLIGRAVVLCYKAGQENQALVAFIIPATKEVSSEDILGAAKRKLKPYEVPEVRIIGDIPLLVNGKVDRQRLLSTFEAEREQDNGLPEDFWVALKIPAEMASAARALIETVSDVTNFPTNEIVGNFDESFFNLGGTSLNTVTAVTKLRLKKFYIELEQFVLAKSLREMLPKISATPPSLSTASEDGMGPASKYYSEFLAPEHESDAMAIIAHSFSKKGDLEVYTNASYQDFAELVKKLYPTLLEKGLSFIVIRKEDEKPVAVALNFDLYDEPESVEAAPGIETVLEFLEYIESRQRAKLPKGKGKILHSFMMGTGNGASEAENVPVITFMEKENTRIAKLKGFQGVMTTNTNPLTMQVGSDLMGYETLIEYQVNQYATSTGARPFRMAPDEQKVICCWTQLQQEN